jgi:hypothetical protein
MPYYNPRETRIAINEYYDNLPKVERQELKDELTYNLKFYDEFALAIGNLSYLLSIFLYRDGIKSSEFINDFIKQGPPKNQYILNMYDFYLESFPSALIEVYGEEKGTHAFVDFKSIIEKTFLYSELSFELEQNKEKITKSKI